MFLGLILRADFQPDGAAGESAFVAFAVNLAQPKAPRNTGFSVYLGEMDYDQWYDVMRTNLGSCFFVTRCVIEGMRERGFGRIVNIGSINGQAGQYGQVNYAAAKSGIHGFTKALAQESAAKGITVNAIAPGYVATDMVMAVPEPVLERIIAKIPVGRLGEARDIARGVKFLVSDNASFITGSTLSINGGQHMY